MIRLASTRRADTVTDATGCLRLFGGVFLLSGTVALSFAFLGAMEAESWIARGVVAAIGLAHLAGGYAVGWGRWNECTVTRAGIVLVQHRMWRRPVRRHIAPSQVREVTVRVKTDSDGDEAYGVELQLVDGECLQLTRYTVPVRLRAEEIRDVIRARLGFPALASGAPGSCQRPEPLAVSRRPRRASLQR